ncbi:hypothetical protein HERIO_2452 [Hepatospora eriocheir]|uniref:Uncharacterized protein n=1 Tax=Hepatospora eriocheir TaxID=1081669 RepID=A0A1X0Q6V4_9MICR|nr:hypothetical protein HERIO_2452 [Hepatospora eriocheir]
MKENLISFKKLKKSKNKDKIGLNEESKIIKTNKLEINHQTINMKIKKYCDQLECRYKKSAVKQEQFEKFNEKEKFIKKKELKRFYKSKESKVIENENNFYKSLSNEYKEIL